MMETRRRPWLTVVIGLTALLVFVMTMPRELNLFDEGLILTGAMRVLEGALVHRDFYSSYGPAQYYAVAAALHLGSDDFLAARAWDLAIRAGIVANIFWVISRVTTLPWALMFAAIATLWLMSAGGYLYPIFPSLLLALVAASLLLDVAKRPPVSWATFAAGGCVGAAALFRYDVGFFLMISFLLSATMLIAKAGANRSSLKNLALFVLTFGVGIAVVFLPPAVAFLFSSPVRFFYEDIVAYSIDHYARMRALPFPSFGDLQRDTADFAAYIPIVALVLAALEFAPRVFEARASSLRNGGLSPSTACLITFTCLTGALLLKGLVRVSPLHMLLATLPSLVLFALVTERLRRGGAVHRTAAGLLVLIVAVAPMAMEKREILRSIAHPERTLISAILAGRPPGAIDRCMRGPGSGSALVDRDLAQAAHFIAARTRSDEAILSALDRHDKIYLNSVALYFAAGRRPATHWYQFDPGLQTRADIQTAMVRELRDGAVNWIVRDARFSHVSEPNGSALSSGVKILDTYIDRNYRPVVAFGKVSVWLRKGVTPTLYGPPSDCVAT